MEKRLKIHIVSNGKLTLQQFAEKASLIESYVDFFHLREKAMSASELMEGILLLTKAGVPLKKIIINDRVDVAAVANVAGVQLAFHSLSVSQVKSTFPTLLVGKSVHSLEEAVQAEKDGADYLLYGHIFPTKSKLNLPARGLKSLQEIAQAVEVPVIAIGGMKPYNVLQVKDTGATGMAIMSGVLEEEDPLKAIKSYVHEEEITCLYK